MNGPCFAIRHSLIARILKIIPVPLILKKKGFTGSLVHIAQLKVVLSQSLFWYNSVKAISTCILLKHESLREMSFTFFYSFKTYFTLDNIVKSKDFTNI